MMVVVDSCVIPPSDCLSASVCLSVCLSVSLCVSLTICLCPSSLHEASLCAFQTVQITSRIFVKLLSKNKKFDK